MNAFSKGYASQDISSLTMQELKPLLCTKYDRDPLKCCDCPVPCTYGKQAIKLLDFKTRTTNMNKRDIVNLKRKIDAIQNYVDASSSTDPVQYILTNCSINTEKDAKLKLYQWRHNYGKNIGMLQAHLLDLKAEYAAASSDLQDPEKEDNKKPATEATEEKPKRISKKQKNKNMSDGLSERRAELEAELLANDDEIKKLTKQIEKYQNRNTVIETSIKALMAALEVFKEENE